MAARTKRRPVHVYSKYHPDRPCTPCILCGKSGVYYTHFAAWQSNEKDFILRHYGRALLSTSCICKADHEEAKRHQSEPMYIPKWKRKTPKLPSDNKQCIYPNCTVCEKLITPAFQSIASLEATVGVQATSEQPFLLCPQHYQQLYRVFSIPKPCAGCGMKPKFGSTFVRHSPDALTVTRILQETTDFEGHINPDDVLCYSCYKLHLYSLQKIESERKSSDDALQTCLEIWQVKLSERNTDHLTRALLKTAFTVGDAILHQRAMLLPEACEVFLQAHTCDDQGLDLEVEEGSVKFSSRWLLNELILYLKPHLSSKCIHRRFGTLLYRTGGDLLTSLSWAHGTKRILHAGNKSDETRPRI